MLLTKSMHVSTQQPEISVYIIETSHIVGAPNVRALDVMHNYMYGKKRSMCWYSSSVPRAGRRRRGQSLDQEDHQTILQLRKRVCGAPRVDNR